MRHAKAPDFTAFLGPVLLLVFVGCASTPPTHFFVLAPMESPAVHTSDVSRHLGIDPIKLPDYLDRPQIVTLDPPNGVTMSEFSRWAEPLNDGFSRVLRENLRTLDPSLKVYPFPNMQIQSTGTPLDYRLHIRVHNFSGTPDGGALLTAEWSLYDGSGKTLLVEHKSNIREPGARAGEAAVAGAMSRALEQLSRAIAEAIQEQEP